VECIVTETDFSNIILALATLLIAIFTIVLAFTTYFIHRHSKATERAYIKMSHNSGGTYGNGLNLDEANNCAQFTVTVTNTGRTPADVTDVYIRWFVLARDQDPPIEASYPPEQDVLPPVSAFLVANDSFLNGIELTNISDAQFATIKAHTNKLWISGYVEYKDISGKRHRAGYTRIYSHGREGNNLIFPAKANYNYDRPI
jgi:hypothetical protein